MSDYEYKEGQFSLFPNDKKGNEKAPDMRGKGMINGEIVELSAWTRKGSKSKFLSGVIKPEYKAKPADQPKQEVKHEDDLPF
jgi:hypothetical protein